MSKEQVQEKVLFEDKDVKITNNFVYIKWYYFPTASTKKIPIKDIKLVEKRQLGFAKARLWGMDATNWGYWLAGDKSRFSRTHFIGITVAQSSIKPSFTTQQVDEVYFLLKKLVRNKYQQQIQLEQQKSNTGLKSSERQQQPLKKQL